MTDFQRRASEVGALFHKQCVVFLKTEGFTIISENIRIKEIGVEVDILFTDGNTEYYGECKGSVGGNRPGLRRTDTVKKAIANAYLLQHADTKRPFVLMTSHLPKPESAGDRSLGVAVDDGIIHRLINIYQETWKGDN